MQRTRYTQLNHTLTLTLVLLGLALAPAWAATLNVPSATFPTIQSALDAAADGDTVRVDDGTFAENLTMATVNVTLRGDGNSTVLVPQTSNTAGITVSAAGVTIRDLRIRHGDGDAIVVNGAAGTTIDDVTIQNPGESCIAITGGDNTPVKDSTLQACTENGVRADADDGV